MVKRLGREERRTIYNRIDVPSDKLFCCFYCGCVATEEDHMPPVSRYHDYFGIYDRHAPLLIPSCRECNILLSSTMQADIYKRFDEAKRKLTAKWSKVLRYGEIWTEEAAEYADFSGNFEVFVEQAQRMAKITQERLDWMHWPVSIDGNMIDIQEVTSFIINGRTFTSIDHLYEHARKVDKIPLKYLEAVIRIVGYDRLTFAYNLCKVRKVKSEAEMKIVLQELVDEMGQY